MQLFIKNCIEESFSFHILKYNFIIAESSQVDDFSVNRNTAWGKVEWKHALFLYNV